MSTPENKGFLSAGITALSPWSSRSATPKIPSDADQHEKNAPVVGISAQRGGDHTVSRRSRLSLRRYPPDCPPLVVRWFHAVDIPKRKPVLLKGSSPPQNQPPPRPKKWIPFSPSDSRAIEFAYQNLAEEEEAAGKSKEILGAGPSGDQEIETPSAAETRTKVPVNEDFLFDVDVEARELSPTYWLGPIYDVKRGTWFTTDGDPCDENLATQLEEGYLKIKPWRFPKSEKRSESQPRSRPVSLNANTGEEIQKSLKRINFQSNTVTPKSSNEDLRSNHGESPDHTPRTWRLFGTYMNSVVTYQDEMTAWILTDDFLSRMGSTLYSRFMGGGHYAGTKYIRGFVDPDKKKADKAKKDGKGTTDIKEDERPRSSGLAYGDPPKSVTSDPSAPPSEDEEDYEPESSESRRRTLERQMSNYIAAPQEQDSEKQEEEIRRREEKEMREDYKEQNKGEQTREIEHLLLVTHGIGQRLGMRLESVNFIHDVNMLRKTLKSVYASSPDLQALNSDVEQENKNSRVQVLPICWRHLLDFPKQSLKHNRKEHDLGDLDADDSTYPDLTDITVEGVPAVRNLVTDLALDILLYQTPAYKGHITRIVRNECNRIYKLFKERNPSFNGKVSLVGHSLGSAVMFDILCQQRDERIPAELHKPKRGNEDDLTLDFEVEDFYALGSPIGLFQMLKGHRIAARPSLTTPDSTSDGPDDPFSSPGQGQTTRSILDGAISSPKCQQMFNIFHPTDPISYRIEPLVSQAMSALKPQPIPYTKKGIFGAPVAQGITGIGARVGQGVTDFWANVSSGIASGLINRSLGITGADASKLSSDLTYGDKPPQKAVVGAGTNLSGGVLPSQLLTPGETRKAFIGEERSRRLREERITEGEEGERPPTLLDEEIETLYAGFQKQRGSRPPTEDGNDGDKDIEWKELEEKSRRLKREEAKIRALNKNGRVDYSIQEGTFDISLLASIASHLSYWSDEDVSHFIISQLLARHRVFIK